jgi:hypothetical protein
MSRPPDCVIDLGKSTTLSLCEYKTGGSTGYWLYDKTRGMNLSMRAKSEREAFIEALHYYQQRLSECERAHASLKSQVDAFISQFSDAEGEAE